MSFDWTAIEQEAQKEINRAETAKGLEGLRIKYLGRQGLLAKATGSISTLTAQERPEFGKKVNILKNNLIRLLEEKTRYLKEQKDASKPANGTEHSDVMESFVCLEDEDEWVTL